MDVVTKTLEQTLAIKIKEIVDDLKGILSADINPLKAEVKNLRDDLNESSEQCKAMKKVLLEQQKALESLKREKNRNNVFISGIPNAVMIADNETVDNKTIVDHILKFVLPTITEEDYKIDKAFVPKIEFTRHCYLIIYK